MSNRLRGLIANGGSPRGAKKRGQQDRAVHVSAILGDPSGRGPVDREPRDSEMPAERARERDGEVRVIEHRLRGEHAQRIGHQIGIPVPGRARDDDIVPPLEQDPAKLVELLGRIRQPVQ